jgi:fructose-1,6-bisphosphatase I
MQTVFDTIKTIALSIDHAIKTEDLGYCDSSNATGDDQLKLDVKSDYIVEEAFKNHPLIRSLISEEKEEELLLNPSGKYTLCYDPLDGSSLADVNLSVGSIFGIYDGKPEGKTLVAAAYVVYGPRIEMVTVQKGQRPRHYRAQGEYFNFICEIELKEKGKLNAPGGTQQHWAPHHKAFVDALFAEGYRLRYSGGMVPDLHQILLKGGGIFSYPGTTDKPEGKLRQLFEVLPFALIYEAAGGAAIDARGKPLLELIPRHLHDTTPCFFGSHYEIEKLKTAYGHAS